jgi:hypothetical protein
MTWTLGADRVFMTKQESGGNKPLQGRIEIGDRPAQTVRDLPRGHQPGRDRAAGQIIGVKHKGRGEKYPRGLRLGRIFARQS